MYYAIAGFAVSAVIALYVAVRVLIGTYRQEQFVKLSRKVWEECQQS